MPRYSEHSIITNFLQKVENLCSPGLEHPFTENHVQILFRYMMGFVQVYNQFAPGIDVITVNPEDAGIYNLDVVTTQQLCGYITLVLSATDLKEMITNSSDSEVGIENLKWFQKQTLIDTTQNKYGVALTDIIERGGIDQIENNVSSIENKPQPFHDYHVVVYKLFVLYRFKEEEKRIRSGKLPQMKQRRSKRFMKGYSIIFVLLLAMLFMALGLVSDSGGEYYGSESKDHHSGGEYYGSESKDHHSDWKDHGSQEQDSSSQENDSKSQGKDSDSQGKKSRSQKKESRSQKKESRSQKKESKSQKKKSRSQKKESKSQKNNKKNDSTCYFNPSGLSNEDINLQTAKYCRINRKDRRMLRNIRFKLHPDKQKTEKCKQQATELSQTCNKIADV